MIMDAFDRVRPMFDELNLLLATSEDLRELMADESLFLEQNILTEPAHRNTLGAQCWIVANLIAAGKGDSTLAILTADHVIGAVDHFQSCVKDCMSLAETVGGIVTLGVVPTRPETGYGYIEEDRTRPVVSASGKTAYQTRSFREKPSLETAENFIDEGTFLWNSGMFFYTVKAFLSELNQTQPQAHEITLAIADAIQNGDLPAATAHFELLPNLSIDYAVMERSEQVTVLRADFPWDDFGAWDALERIFPVDNAGNVAQGDVLLVESRSSIIFNAHPTLRIGVLGLTDIVVVASEEGILICDKRDVQRVRLLAKLDEKT